MGKLKHQIIISSVLMMILGLLLLIILEQYDGILIHILGYAAILLGAVMVWDFIGGNRKLKDFVLFIVALQTVVTLVVLAQMGMSFPGEGLFTPWLYVNAGITILLITYASDLLSLWISSLVHTTTTAMTIMPFVLIFQLLFSGCMFPLPQGVTPIRKLTVSSPGIKAMASQAKVNDLPYSSVTDMMNIVDDVELGGYVTVGQVLDTLGAYGSCRPGRDERAH